MSKEFFLQLENVIAATENGSFQSFEEIVNINPSQQKELHGKLRSLFLYGNHEGVGKQSPAVPVGIILQKQNYRVSEKYPVVWDDEEARTYSLSDYLIKIFCDIMPDADNDQLSAWSGKIVKIVNSKLSDPESLPNYDFQVMHAFDDLLNDKEGMSEAQSTIGEKLKKAALARRSILVNPRKSLGVQILEFILQNHNKKSLGFRDKIKDHINSIQEILLLQDHAEPVSKNDDFGFASELLALDEIEDASTVTVSTQLSEARIQQLRQALQILADTYQSMVATVNHVFVSKKISDAFAVKDLISCAIVTEVDEGDIASVRHKAEKIYRQFIDTIAAMRLAEVESHQQYVEALHGTYFQNFNEHYLKEEDFEFLPRIIMLVESRSLTAQIGDLLSILPEKNYVKIFALTTLNSFYSELTNLSEDHKFLGLSSMLMGNHTTSIFQCGETDPELLAEYLQLAISTTEPVFGHFFVTESHTDMEREAINMAMHSRLFPCIKYQAEEGSFSDRYDISDNAQYNHEMVSLSGELPFLDGVQNQVSDMTLADFYGIVKDAQTLFTFLPEQYQDDRLIPFSDYLADTSSSIQQKIPFIWMVNAHGQLQRAIVPADLVSFNRNRLDFWNMLKDQGLVRDHQMEAAMEEAELIWESKKNQEIEAIKEQLSQQFNASREQDLQHSITNILFALMDGDLDLNQMAAHSAVSITDTRLEGSEAMDEKPVIPTSEAAPKESIVEIKKEAWIESDECTSCNDCIQTAPGVFEYNEDKQAYVHNPSGAPYAKIVSAAEKCPAACIHPGLPHNSDEPNLEKLLKRAERFN